MIRHRRTLSDALFALGMIGFDRTRVGEVLSHLNGNDFSALDSLISFHRVTPQAVTTLRRCDLISVVPGSFSGRLQARAATIERRRDALWRDLHTCFAGSSIEPVLLKGASAESYYSEATGSRGAADIDILIPAGAFGDAIRRLHDLGYQVERVRLGSHGLEPVSNVGLEAIIPAKRLILDDTLGLDVHVTSFPACGPGVVMVADEDIVHGREYGTLALPKSLEVYLAHVARQGFVRLRDINDYGLMYRGMAEDSAVPPELLPLLRSVQRLDRWLRSGATRRLAPLDRSLLLGCRRPAPSFTDGVTVYLSRMRQLQYLFLLQRRQISARSALPGIATSAYWLFRSGRPYRVGSRHPERDSRVVLRPLASLPASASRDSAFHASLTHAGFIFLDRTVMARVGYFGSADDQLAAEYRHVTQICEAHSVTWTPLLPSVQALNT